jgi:hypothetical protein
MLGTLVRLVRDVVGGILIGYALATGILELRAWWRAGATVSRETPPRRPGGGLDIWEAIATADELAAARADPSATGRRLLERGTAVFDGRLAVDSAAAGGGVPRALAAGDDDGTGG